MLLVLTISVSDLCAQTRKVEKAQLEKHRLSRLRGMRVENEDGEKMGDTSNFIINVNSGEVLYSLIQSHGVAVLGSSIKIVPIKRLSSATIKKGVLLLDVGLRQWKHAPTFKKGDLGKLANPVRGREIASFYGIPAHSSQLAPTGPATQSSPPERARAGPGDFRLATDLLGAKVFDTKNESLGLISDLLIDLSDQKPPLAVVSEKRLFTTRSSFAINLSAVSVRANKLIVEATPAKVEQSPFLTVRDWKTASVHGPMVYRVTE
jgi:sporulation protein YlmC with PRC-barrel domain